jgi:uncharacterized membrane protein YczE
MIYGRGMLIDVKVYKINQTFSLDVFWSKVTISIMFLLLASTLERGKIDVALHSCIKEPKN